MEVSRLYLGVKKVGLFSEIFLSKTASSVQFLNTTQHIKETLSNAINLSGTRRPAWNFSYEKFPAGLFCLNHFRLIISQFVRQRDWVNIKFKGGF